MGKGTHGACHLQSLGGCVTAGARARRVINGKGNVSIHVTEREKTELKVHVALGLSGHPWLRPRSCSGLPCRSGCQRSLPVKYG